MMTNVTHIMIVVVSLRRKAYHGILPKLDDAEFIAPNACIIGDVAVNESTSVWYGTVLRGDTSPIIIGKHSVI
jgi:carbonic anhydrase/acetyltransferase-like protein (isoleucine patch superfamily)